MLQILRLKVEQLRNENTQLKHELDETTDQMQQLQEQKQSLFNSTHEAQDEQLQLIQQLETKT